MPTRQAHVWYDSAVPRRPIPPAPARFEGSLEELYREHIERVLPDVDVVLQFHRALHDYLRLPEPLFLVRYLAGMERGVTLKVPGGLIRPTDNSPAWMVHRLLFDRVHLRGAADFASFTDSVPCHFHQLSGTPSVSQAGWHVAHIFPAKDGNTSYRSWDRSELIRRFVRSLHPCNCFYVPKLAWHRYGGDSDVLAFAAEVYRDRYREVWSDFLNLAVASDLQPPAEPPHSFRYVYGQPDAYGDAPAPTLSRSATIEYSATRLLFRRDVIETLSAAQRFRVVTRDHGTFEMSRAEFEQVFDNILKSASWQRGGLYHMPRPPAKAMRFRVRG